MLGKLILKIRKDKNLTGSELAKSSNIDTGHLSHIERGERTPSHKTLKLICDTLDVPYSPLLQTYDINLTEEQKEYEIQNHIMYDKIPVFDNFVKYTKLPIGLFNSSFAIKSIDDSMEPKIGTEDYIFIQQNAPLSNKDIGIFFINNEFIIRKFIIRKKDISLRPENKNYDEIQVNKDSDFYIIGKVLGKSDKSFTDFVEF